MRPPVNIRRVNVEFLRPGPSHNQLLSPYTQYLAVCNDAGAAVVTVPYEHRVFERRLKELRYETGDQSDRLDMLHEVGRDIGRILEGVPGFTGALTSDSGEATLVHLRITLSAAELAMLPFELAEVPVGSAASALAIQTRPAVSVTRHIRTVPSDGVVWPQTPRVLFVSGDPEVVPFEEHCAALEQAIRSFQYPGRDDETRSPDGRRRDYGELLTILLNPTLAELQHACDAAEYTHIHVLTHGDLDGLSNESYGLVLRHEDGATDIVSGERFVSAITRVGHHPTVVTIASCDSGNVGSVVIPGASFAHAIHQAGIPFVVGAQFPLSKDGSIPLAARLYSGLLWGEHPLYVLQQARAELHARYNTSWHDWASVVVYEALPPTIDNQLDQLRFSQARRAIDGALERVDRAVRVDRGAMVISGRTPESLAQLRAAVSSAIERLPLDGRFALECIGLRASSQKRLAQAAFTLAAAGSSPGDALDDQYDLLERARLDYWLAVKGLLVNDARTLQRKATLHWVLVQVVALATVLGQKLEGDEWGAARLAAEYYCEHPDQEERAWAHASLAELALLRLANASAADAEEFARTAREHVSELSRLYPGTDDFPVKSTRRQFARYVNWWGVERFEQGLPLRGGEPRRPSFRDGRLVDEARNLVDLLQRGRTIEPGPDEQQPPPSPTVPATPSTQTPTPPPAPLSPATTLAREGGAQPQPALRPRTGDRPFFRIDALPAGHGDCLWIEYGEGASVHRVLVDCGVQATSKPLLARIGALPANEQFFELFVMTHIDSDHLGGALPLFNAVKRGLRFGDVWFNGWRHVSGQLGARDAEMFSTAIQDFELPWNAWRDGKTIMIEGNDLPEHELPGGLKLTLLSPGRPQLDKLKPVWVRELKKYGLEPGARVDYSRFLRGTPTTIADAAALQNIDALADSAFGGDSGAPNGTSIALLAEFGGAAILLGADAHAPVLAGSIKALAAKRGAQRLKVDLFKVSHHGSQNNVSSDLIQLLDCPRYLISTNGDIFCHPDRQAIARILKYGGAQKTLHFNYLSPKNEVWGAAALADVRARYGCTTAYPAAGSEGTSVTVL